MQESIETGLLAPEQKDDVGEEYVRVRGDFQREENDPLARALREFGPELGAEEQQPGTPDDEAQPAPARRQPELRSALQLRQGQEEPPAWTQTYTAQIAGGVRDAAQGLVGSVGDLLRWAEEQRGENIDWSRSWPYGPFMEWAAEGGELPNIPEDESGLKPMVRDAAHFVTGMLATVGPLKALRIPAILGLTGRVGGAVGTAMEYEMAGAITDALTRDPHEERLSNLIQSYPILANPVTEYLAASPDDTNADGRLKNALEGLGLGLVTALPEAFVRSLRALRAARQARAAKETVEGVAAAGREIPEAAVDEARLTEALRKSDEPLVDVVDEASPAVVNVDELLDGMAPGNTFETADAIRDVLEKQGWKVSRKSARETDSVYMEADYYHPDNLNEPAISRKIRVGGHDPAPGKADSFDIDIGTENRDAGDWSEWKTVVGALLEKQAKAAPPPKQILPTVREAVEYQARIKKLTLSDEEIDGIAAEIGEVPASKVGTAVAEALEKAKETIAQGSRPTIKGRLILPVAKEAAEEFTQAGVQSMEMGLQVPARAVNINFSRLNTAEDVQEVIARVADVRRSEMEGARRGVRTHPETIAAANKMLADNLGETVEKLLSRRAGQAFNAEEALAAREIMEASARVLVESAQQAAGGGREALFAFRRNLAVHQAIQKQVHGLTAEAGRVLNQFKIPAGGAVEQARMIDAMIETSGGGKLTEEMARKLAMIPQLIEDPEAAAKMLNKVTRDMEKVTTSDVLLEIWINGLLSNPQTHAVNFVSNGLVASIQVPERLLAAGFGRLMGDQEVLAKEAVYQLKGAVEGMKDGVRLAGQVLKTGEPADPLMKMELARHRAITGEALKERFGTVGRAVDLLGEGVRVPGRLLTAADEFWKSIGYRMELHARAYREALGEGLEGEAAARRIAEIIDDPPESVRLAAQDAAQYQTFTNPLGKTGRHVQSAIASQPYLRLIVPFMRTPANILKYTFEHTPLAPVSARIRGDILAGGARRDLALARMSLGSMVMAVAADFAAAGYITGDGPSNPLLRARWLETHQPNSIRIGDTWYSYSRLEPVGALFGIAATIAEMAGELDEDENAEITTAAAIAAAKYATSRTWLRSMSDAFDALSNPDRSGPRFIRRLAGSIVPAGVAQIERTLDPTLRATESILDEVKSRIPGLSATLPPRRNLWGEPIILGGGLGPDMISPVYTKDITPHPVDDELLRNRVKISMPAKQVDGVRLTPEEYDRYVSLAGNELTLPATGLGLKDTLEQLINSPEYQQMSDGPDGTKALMVRKYITMFRQLAKRRLIEEFPDLRLRVREKRLERAMKRRGAVQ